MKNMLRLVLLLLLAIPFIASAQTKKERKGEFYFSWGYNKEWYTHSNVRVNQPELNNNYTFKQIHSQDHIGWDMGLLKIPLSIPQYNYRVGYIFDKKRGLGFEINFDHTKHIITDGQQAHIVGTLGGRQVDSTLTFSEANGFVYFLNNGANFLLFNIVKRWNWQNSKTGNFKLDFLGKAGIGPVIPHVENTLFGKENTPGFQLGGWNMGVEAGIRTTFYKSVYLEFTNKIDYARYSNLKVYKGTAKQAFGTYELILSLGYTFPMGKRVG